MSRFCWKGGFSVIWDIDNFNYSGHSKGERLKSPFFNAYNLEWSLTLYPRGKNDSNFIAVELNAMSSIHKFDCFFAILDANNSSLIRKELIHKDGGKIFTNLIPRDEVFGLRKSTFLPENTLTILCRILKARNDFSMPDCYYFHTSLETNFESLSFKIANFKSVCRNVKTAKKFPSMVEYGSYLNVELSMDTTEFVRLKITLSKSRGSPNAFAACKVSVLAATGKRVSSFENDCFFDSTNNSWDFLYPTQKYLMRNQSLFLPKGCLTLVLDCTLSAGVSYSRSEELPDYYEELVGSLLESPKTPNFALPKGSEKYLVSDAATNSVTSNSKLTKSSGAEARISSGLIKGVLCSNNGPTKTSKQEASLSVKVSIIATSKKANLLETSKQDAKSLSDLSGVSVSIKAKRTLKQEPSLAIDLSALSCKKSNSRETPKKVSVSTVNSSTVSVPNKTPEQEPGLGVDSSTVSSCKKINPRETPKKVSVSTVNSSTVSLANNTKKTSVQEPSLGVDSSTVASCKKDSQQENPIKVVVSPVDLSAVRVSNNTEKTSEQKPSIDVNLSTVSSCKKDHLPETLKKVPTSPVDLSTVSNSNNTKRTSEQQPSSGVDSSTVSSCKKDNLPESPKKVVTTSVDTSAVSNGKKSKKNSKQTSNQPVEPSTLPPKKANGLETPQPEATSLSDKKSKRASKQDPSVPVVSKKTDSQEGTKKETNSSVELPAGKKSKKSSKQQTNTSSTKNANPAKDTTVSGTVDTLPLETTLPRDLWEQYKRGIFTDTKLLVGDKTFPVHKNILAARSSAFLTMFVMNCDGDGVRIEDVDADTLQHMIRFIYTDTLQEGLQFKELTDLFSAADKYELPYLKDTCVSQLRPMLSVSTACELFRLADTYQEEDLKVIVVDFIVQHEKDLVGTRRWK